MGRRIAVHRSEIGCWEAVVGAASAELAGFVEGGLTGWTENAPGAVRRRETPEAFIPVILTFAGRYVVSPSTGEAAAAQALASFAAGPSDRCTLVESRGETCCLQVNLTHDGAYRLFKLPMRDLLNQVTALDDLLGPAGLRLVEALGDAQDWGTRFDLLEQFLLERLRAAPGLSPHVAWAVGTIARSRGSVSIGSLSGAIGASRKRLIADFHEEIGLPPKTLARIHRFGGAIHRLRRATRGELASIALDCGYCDQAHFNRDFVDFAGVSPTAYLAERRASAEIPTLDAGG